MLEIVNAAVILIAAVLFVFGVLVLCGAVALTAICGWWFARAVREAHTARAHAAQADETQRIIDAAEAALEEPRPVARAAFDNPTDQELRDIIRGRRADMDDITTTGNEGIPEQPPIMAETMYRQSTNGS
jgi:hypothetical protein